MLPRGVVELLGVPLELVDYRSLRDGYRRAGWLRDGVLVGGGVLVGAGAAVLVGSGMDVAVGAGVAVLAAVGRAVLVGTGVFSMSSEQAASKRSWTAP